MGTRGQMVGGRAMAQMSMDDDPHPLELFEVAVNRREVDVWSLDMDRLRQLFGRPMARCVEECVEKKASRARDAPSLLPDQGQYVLHSLDPCH